MQPPAPQQTPPPIPRTPTADARAAESYGEISAAIVSARDDVESFARSVEGVQGQLFRLRHGVDPQVLADIFTSGGEAANGLVDKITEIDDLISRGAVGSTESLKLIKGEITQAAADQKPAPTPSPTTAPGENPEWVQRLIDGMEGANRHVLIEGMSGSGKSVMARNVAFQRMEKGEEVHVVDTHTPEQWKGAASVFGAKTAGSDAASFLKELREGFYARKEEAATQGVELTQADFKPMTIVLSDFKKLLQDYPKLAEEVNAMLQEGRKFNVSILAEAASLSGVKGVESMRPNFAQKVQMFAPSSDDPQRTAVVGGKKFATPDMDVGADRFDASIIRTPRPAPPPEPKVEPAFDPTAEADKRRQSEQRAAQVRAAYREKYGDDDAEDQVGKVINLAGKFRGALGGLAGTLVGVGLDIVSELYRAHVEVQSKKRDMQLLAEASATAAQPATLAAPPPPVPAPTLEVVGSTPPVEVPPPVVGDIPPVKVPVVQPPDVVPVVQQPTVTPTVVQPEPVRLPDAGVGTAEFEPPTVLPPEPVQAPPTIPPDPAQAPPTVPPPPAQAPTTTPASPGTRAPAPATPRPGVPPAVPGRAVAPNSTAAAATGASSNASAAATGAEAAAGAEAASAAGGAEMAAAGGPVGVAAAVAITAVVALGTAIKSVVDEMSRSADKLAEYNSTLASAQARAEVRETYGDIRRAEQAAPVLSRFADARSQLDEQLKDLQIQFMETVGPAVTELLNAANIAVQILSEVLKFETEIIQLISNVPIIKEIFDILVAAWEWVKRRFITDDSGSGDESFYTVVNDLFTHINF